MKSEEFGGAGADALEVVSEAVGQPLCVVRKGRVAYANPLLLEMLGVRAEDVCGTPLYDLISPEHLRAVEPLLTETETPPPAVDLLVDFSDASSARSIRLKPHYGRWKGEPALLLIGPTPLRPLPANDSLLIKRAPLGYIELRPDFTVGCWNDAAARVFGYAGAEILGNSADVLFPTPFRPDIRQRWQDLLDGTGTLRDTHDNLTKSDLSVRCTWHYTPLVEGDHIVGIAALVEDITERVRSEAELRGQRNLYRALTETNHAIMRITHPQDLFEAVCRIAVEFGGFKLAWIGEPGAGDGTIKPVACYGDLDYLRLITISMDRLKPEGKGPGSLALNEGRPMVVNDFLGAPFMKAWHQAAAQTGVKAAAAFPIRRDARPVALLNVYSDEKGYFTPSLISLIEEMANDISFGLDNFDREVRRKQAEADRERLIAILEATPDFVGIADPNGKVLYHNTGARQMLGRHIRNGQPWRVEHSHPDWAAELVRNEGFPTALRDGHWQGETAIINASGREIPVSQIILAHRDDNGAITHLSTIARDISERKAAEEKIRHLAHYDALTKLPNRVLLRDRLERDLARAIRHRHVGAVLFLDLDRFKTINDSLGHPAGDALLIHVAERLQNEVRAEDTVARIGGDEFVVIIANAGEERERAVNTIRTVADKIKRVLSRPYNVMGYELHVTPSIGITLFADKDDTVDNLLKHADTAMYRAKAAGRETFQFFLPSMQEAAQARLQLEKNLRLALERDDFRLHFQAQVNTDTCSIIGAEALLRWEDPERGLVLPGEFVPLAEDTALILSIGDWVLRAAVAQLGQWLANGVWDLEGTLAINVSPRQFRQPDFVENITDILAANDVPAYCLKLEITEGVLINDLRDTIEKIKALKALGVGVAIDDFGTGYSSLVYLKQLPLDTLKIDKSFIDQLPEDSSDGAIADTIIAIAQRLDLEVIAEGVENENQMEFLRARGCRTFQGNYFAEPVCAERFAALVEKKDLAPLS